MTAKMDIKVYESDPSFNRQLDKFLDASSRQDWKLCSSLRGVIEAQWPGAFDVPYTEVCLAVPGRTGQTPTSVPKGGKHRWFWYKQFEEERCIKCGCQRSRETT